MVSPQKLASIRKKRAIKKFDELDLWAKLHPKEMKRLYNLMKKHHKLLRKGKKW